MRADDDGLDYDRLRGRHGPAKKQLAPLVFELFYPLILAIIMTTAASMMGYIDLRQLDLSQHFERFVGAMLRMF